MSVPQVKIDYTQYTVKELKVMIGEKKASLWLKGNKKADYIKALEDHDSYEESHNNFMTSIQQIGEGMKKQQDDNIKKLKEIKEKTQQIRDACQKADAAIKILEEKEGKTIEDYENLVKILKSRMKLMKDW